MRNLFVSHYKEYAIPGLNLVSEEVSQKLIVVDHIKNTVFVESGGFVYGYSPEDGALVELFNANEYYAGEAAVPTIVGMCYFQVTDTICLAVDKGDLLSFNAAPLAEVECVGFVESGLQLMEPSPDEDVLVLVTAQNTVITMTASFDPINETDLQQKEFGENRFITVGWGKKETQFHGSEGKAAALAKATAQTAPEPKFDKGVPQITWRGDGTLFAVNSVNQETGERFVRIFDRKGDLMYTSERIPGLEGVVSWRPSGNLMACTQRMPNKHVVCFLEKNGLRHGDFTLPFALDTVRVRQLLWNAESSILLVWCQVLEGVTPPEGLVAGQHTLLLWSVNNYHWYLKQRIDLKTVFSPVAIRWDMESGNRLHIVCTGAKYIRYQFSWRVDHSNGMNSNDGAFVGVIDGDSLLLTSFRHNVIPPPMCGTTLKLAAPALEVVFAPRHVPSAKESEIRYLNTSSTEDSGFGEVVESLSSNSNNFLVLMSNGMFDAYSYVGGPRAPNPSHTLAGTYRIDCDGAQNAPTQSFHHWTWVSRDTMLCSTVIGNVSYLCVFEMDTLGAAEFGRISLKKKIILVSNVESIAMGVETNIAFIQLTEGKVLKYSIESNALVEVFTFPHPVVKMVACRVDKEDNGGQEIILGLANHNRLYANTDLVMSNVTSFDIHSQFLLLTSSQQQLFCCPLKRASILSLTKTSAEIVSFGVAERKVERGSRLVTVVPDGNRVILQMPRGNLECIEPRALSLCQLAILLNSKSYFEAFDLARKQRINLNLFVDHNADLFLENIDLFVKRVTNPQWLCLFLAELQDEDCTTTMYKAHYPNVRPTSLSDKINTVCDAFLASVKKMNEADSAKLTLPILTALVLKSTPGGLESALTLVKTLKESPEKMEGSVPWTSALRHLLYLRDVNQLMDAALGMYDFNLVVLVASKSQKDPKEYLAFLNKLREMEPNYQRYSIDKHLRKWESALVHLIQCPDDCSDELFQFVINQGLFREALRALPESDERFKMIASAYGDKLGSQQLYKEAAVMYRRANDFYNAMVSHQKALAWRHCIQDATAANISDEERKELLSDLATSLQENRLYKDAAVIFETYLQQPSDAVKALCLGHQWPEAQRIATACQLTDSLDTTIHLSALNYAETLSTQVKSQIGDFNTHYSRLIELRKEKQLARERLEAQDGDVGGYGESDLLSDTSSITGSSLSSRSSSGLSYGSNRSSKNRRKQERKLLSLKRGSPHEELALMHALHQCISSSFALREEVNSMNCTLVDFGNDDIAADLQNVLSKSLKTMEVSFNKIWVPSVSQGNNPQQAFGPNATSNMLASSISSMTTNQLDMTLLEPLYRFPPVVRPVKWELDMLKKT